MSKFLEPSDFIGKYKISQNCYDEAVLQSYIDKYEDLYICRLLGSELRDEFYADLDVDNQPQTQRFIDVFESFCKDVDSFGCFKLPTDNHQIESEGMVEMLKGFIYYHYVTSENVKHTIMGLTKSINENSSRATYEMIYRTAEIRYNEALSSFMNIQEFICQDLATYSNWNGVKLTSKFYGVL